jgi:hypothetical protein
VNISAIQQGSDAVIHPQRVTVNVVLWVTVCPDDLAVTVAVAVPAQEALTFHRQV